MINGGSRLALVAAFFSVCVLLVVSVVQTSHGSNPAAGTVSEASPRVAWTGQIKPATGDADCAGANNSACDNYKLTIQPPPAAFGPYLVEVRLQPQGDWDMQVYGPSGKLVDGSGNSPGQPEVVVLVNPPAGTYTVASAPFAPLVGADGISYTATAEIRKHFTNPSVPATENVSYHNFVAPANMGNNAGEPTIGVNWKTNRAMYIAGLESLRVTFDDTALPSKATWENKSFLSTSVVSLDPILFTDRQTGRTFVSQLISGLGYGLGCSSMAFTDNDGDTWVQSEGCGLPTSGADHQSVGGGPFAAPLARDPKGAVYPNAVYYCSQAQVTAFCARSDDGGVTFGPGVPIYTTECGGLHGHPMVAPDGTVYMPNKGCGGNQAVAVSEDNGLTWAIRPVPDSVQAANDPAVGVGAGGTVYFGYQNADGHPMVAVSRDKGRTWSKSTDVGARYNIRNTAFPRVVAGDDDRAAFSFLGTPTEGPFQSSEFKGEWHLYIAHTYDGGATWTTVDVTPTDPVQRGCIWMQGGSNQCRNLLDFMGSTVDREGRVLVGYADGCITAPCIQGTANEYKEKATIARQVNGRRLFKQYDPPAEPTPTPTPTPTATPTPTPGPVTGTFFFHGTPQDEANKALTFSNASNRGTATWNQNPPTGTAPVTQTTHERANRDYVGNTLAAYWRNSFSGTLGGNLELKLYLSTPNPETSLFGEAIEISVFADPEYVSARVQPQRLVGRAVVPVGSIGPTPTLFQGTVPVSGTVRDELMIQVRPTFVDSGAGLLAYYDSTGTPSSFRIGPAATPTPTPTPPTQPAPRFTAYLSPPGFGDDWGEPSIGVNWNTDHVMSFGGFSPHALRVSFDDCQSPARPTWEKSSLTLASQYRPLIDPILFTDRETGRTFVSQLVGGSKQSTLEYTDDDGDTYSVSQGSGINSGVDHQTIGGGPFAAGRTGDGYKNAVYYCAQDAAYANCALSTDGGRTFGPAVPMYTIASCGGLHGHVKVSPADGTVYVPNRNCSGKAGVALSEDNGITWKVRTIPGSTNGKWDASVGVADDGTIYVGYNGSDGRAYAARSTDKGVTWSEPVDVGAQLGVQNILFPAVVAGDRDRASYAFIGTTTGGNYDSNAFTGVWYLYVATTYDGGKTWQTVNATPGDPVQRGRVCASGTACAAPGGGGDTRNLLDFMDATIDREGRVLVTYADGCINECVQGGENSYTAKAGIARQSGGRRMFAKYDLAEPSVPASPDLTATKDASGTFVRLSWSKPDDGGSPVTSYRIYRRADGGEYALLATVPENYFEDHTISSGTAYFYKVTAVNALGEGKACGEAQAGGSSRPNACDAPGPLVANDTKSNGADDDALPNAPQDARLNVRQLFISQPYSEAGNRLVFKLQTAPSPGATTAPPNSQWFVIWNRIAPDANYDRFYVMMKSDAFGAVSYEYGKFGGSAIDASNPNPFLNLPSRLGAAEGTYDPAAGVITITLPTASAENIQPGQHLAFIEARSYFGQPAEGPHSVRTASDATGSGDYVVIDSAGCKVNNPPTAQLFATPLTGYAPLAVSFDASKSSDGDGDPIATYTFNFGDGSPELAQATPSASHTYQAPGNYNATLTVTDDQGARSINVASAVIQVGERLNETIEDDDRRVAYSDAWHLVNDPNASAGHFRYHTGNSPNHSAVLSFDVPQGKTGAITYHFARSPKGGSADLYLDGVFRKKVNFAGGAGTTQRPEFAAGYKETFADLPAGAHRLELRNMSGVVYLDRFSLESATSFARPAAGPGTTTNQSSDVAAGQTSGSSYLMPPEAQGVSVVVESGLNLPFSLALVDSKGLTLETVSAQNGMATISRAVTPGGLYFIKVINLGVGSLQVTTTTTPLVAR